MKTEKIKKLIQNQRGSALIFSLMTLSVLLILGTALLSVNAADNMESIRQDDSLQAYYLAKSGATAMGTGIINNSASMSAGDFQTYLNSIINKTSDPTYIGSSGGYFTVKVVNDASKGLGVISTGTMGSISKTVTVWLTKETQSLSSKIKCAAFAESSIEMDGSCGINGDTYTNIDNPSSINPHNTAPTFFNGNLYVSGSGAQNWNSIKSHITNGTLKTDNPKYTFTMPEFPTIPTLTNKGNFSTNDWEVFHIAANYYYPSITVKGSATLYIDTNNQDCSIVCDNLYLTSNNGIKINGTGTVKFYIKNSISITGGVGVATNVDNLLIYYSGTNDFNLGGNCKIYGSFYAKNSDITVSGSAHIFGIIVTGGDSVTISGGVTEQQTIYAPNAAVSLLNGSGDIPMVRGAVISKTLKLTGSAKITYEDLALSPFDELIGSDSSTSYAFGAWE